MHAYTKTMNFLHQKLLQARTKEQEDRIVNLMVAEAKRNQFIQNSDQNDEKEVLNLQYE
jgi:hypothetical protein